MSKRRRARAETGSGRGTAAVPARAPSWKAKARSMRQESRRWADMAGPVTVRRFDPETGEAIEEGNRPDPLAGRPPAG